MASTREIESMLAAIDPGACNYEDWLRVGMALHDAGAGCGVWDAWSARDAPRYHRGECARKWEGFGGSGEAVTIATVAKMARDAGWAPEREPDIALGWDDLIVSDWVPDWGERIAQQGYDGASPDAPAGGEWGDPAREMSAYLGALFASDEYVGLCVTAFQDSDGKWKPRGKGDYARTCGDVLAALSRGSIEDAIGTVNAESGGWVRINPLDGTGVRNANVADFRHALVECDEGTKAEQLRIITAMELPCAAIVDSGGKSMHAIVKVDAADAAEHARRTRLLYRECEAAGLVVDEQNKNPARLSRLPGLERAGGRQRLVAVNAGRQSWAEWREWVESNRDTLPEAEPFDASEDVGDAEWIIDGLLCAGDKMMFSGASKTGKSFALLALCLCMAAGRPWLGTPTRRGRVLYVNMELKADSRKRRMKAIAASLGIGAADAARVDCLDLRGAGADMDALTRALVRRCAGGRYSMIVIDPLYKVLGGDESDQARVVAFSERMDRIAEGTGSAVVYCHHYAKGDSWAKAAIDRASGSGIFGRDADASVTMTELPVGDAELSALSDAVRRQACRGWMAANAPGCPMPAEDDQAYAGADATLGAAQAALAAAGMGSGAMMAAVHGAHASVAGARAVRIEADVRDAPKPADVDAWFCHPVHVADSWGVLASVRPEGAGRQGGGRADRRRERAGDEAARAERAMHDAYTALSDASGPRVPLARFAEEAGVSERTVRNWCRRFGGLKVSGGDVVPEDYET